MLLVPTLLKNSNIHGLGVFSGVNIQKDKMVWKHSVGIVQIDFSLEEMKSIATIPKLSSLFKRYCYLENNMWYFDLDNGKFMNHSDEPNLYLVYDEDGKGYYYAKKDIYENEELTCDYREFDAAWKEKLMKFSKFI